MERVNLIYPLRAVIRCKAKQQLMTNVDGAALAECLDENLFQELAITLFQSEGCQAIYQPYASREVASAVEDGIALELAAIYQRIMQQRQNPLVQDLNALLS
jgi:hypothetical protein